ncbi:MAG TPA: response regulator, partial [Roseiflexaceae bacterium]|nr:response regulator [Roseiflexaceae bacterium]
EHIRTLTGQHFDPQVVEAFLRLEAHGTHPAQPTILLVDDEEPTLETLNRALSDLFSITTATSCEQALDILARKEIAVIITDQRMPGLSGVQLLERARHIQPETLGILCSAYPDVSALSEALNLGTVRGFIAKPWRAAELRRRVSEVVRQYRPIERPNAFLEINSGKER